MPKKSAYIPEGLLPKRKGNEKEYTRMYHKLRRKYDPYYIYKIQVKNRRTNADYRERQRRTE